MLQLDSNFGVVQVGNRADLILLDATPLDDVRDLGRMAGERKQRSGATPWQNETRGRPQVAICARGRGTYMAIRDVQQTQRWSANKGIA